MNQNNENNFNHQNNINNNYNNYNNYNNNYNNYQNDVVKNELMFTHILCWLTGIIGIFINISKYNKYEGQDKINMANLLNFHISIFINTLLYVLSIFVVVFGMIFSQSEMFILLIIPVCLIFFVYYIILFINLFKISVNVFGGKDIQKTSFTYKIFKY